jgi:CARDB
VIVIAMALLIKNCEGSATTSALKNYNASVYRLIRASTSNAYAVLETDLTGGDLGGVTQTLTTAEQTALTNLDKAKALHAPSQMAAAQTALVTVMTLRQQGLLIIATYASRATIKHESDDAVRQISRGTSLLYSSDVVYKTLVTPALAEALNAASIPAGSEPNGQPIDTSQVVHDLGWLNPTWIADTIGANLPTTAANAGNDQPNLKHGDQLNYTTVDGQQLTNGLSYTIPAADAQTWALNVTNGGQTSEDEVGCSVKIDSVSDEGTATIPSIAAGATDTCTVTLPSKPETGPYTVTATVDSVPRETNLKNNSQTYTITFN